MIKFSNIERTGDVFKMIASYNAAPYLTGDNWHIKQAVQAVIGDNFKVINIFYKDINPMYYGIFLHVKVEEKTDEEKTNAMNTPTTKFRQSVVLKGFEQFYYDQARQMMLDNGFASMQNFIDNELPGISPQALNIAKDRFIELLQLAQKDYMTIMFDPHGLKSGF